MGLMDNIVSAAEANRASDIHIAAGLPIRLRIDGELRNFLGELYEPVLELRRDQQRNRLQARLPYSTLMK